MPRDTGEGVSRRVGKRAWQEGRQEGRQEGLEEGSQEERKAWEEWLERRERAEASGEEFTEPSPSQRAANSKINEKNV